MEPRARGSYSIIKKALNNARVGARGARLAEPRTLIDYVYV